MYNKYSQKKVNPGQKKFMCLDEAIDICKLSELFQKTSLQEVDICQCYNLAMQTQVDELTQQRIFQMSSLEFYECMARIAEKASMPHVDYPLTDE